MASTSTNQPDSDHTELYYSELEEEGQAGSDETESEGEEQTYPPQRAGKRAVGDRKGKGVESTAVEPNAPLMGHDRSTLHSKQRHAEKRSWYDLDLSLVVALISPIGNWLTGSDHIKNLFLILLLIFYLHQLIEMPWQLYHASRPRKPSKRAVRKNESHEATLAHLAHTELQKQELFYLSLAVISPLLGASLIRWVLTALEGVDNLSWFSTTLFVLATGIRPWSHLIGRLQERTHELHDTVHYPSEESSVHHQMEVDRTLRTILQRLDSLDRNIQELEEKAEKMEPLREVCDDLSEAVGVIERNISRQERKVETTRVTQDTRINHLETGLVEMEGRRRREMEALESRFHLSTYTHLYANSHPQLKSFFSGLFTLPNKLLSIFAPYVDSFVPNKSDVKTTSPEPVKVHMRRLPIVSDDTPPPQYLTRLETIPEAEDSDSEGTYVSDKDSNPATPSKKLGTPRNGSRSRSRSDSERKGGDSPATAKIMDYAGEVVAWPYKSAVQLLVMISPPVQKLLF
ncbi:hypothetical protein BXZ70DRAFT_1007640 [Cristinia sonorae]|uniref:Uncharacterized protein n=1 Tax=Cristinia sonorae TaxID=1940300 RepID=A0A8K0UPK3_9AGAR|nr:hypothetical protein BXZ70DRAFT_1007640 [Cristinia sonorae]